MFTVQVRVVVLLRVHLRFRNKLVVTVSVHDFATGWAGDFFCHSQLLSSLLHIAATAYFIDAASTKQWVRDEICECLQIGAAHTIRAIS